jgi:lipid II isoglutaminyl synthase (glutamine-hydrolysing)
MRSFLAVLVGKTARFLLRRIRRGGGSAFPGTVAATIDPNLLKRAIDSAPMGLVVVSGSAGKSSTTKILVELLRAHGLKVFTNPSTANIKQGLYAAILQFGDQMGRIDADIVVLEWDEGHGAALAKSLKPKLAVLTNVFSDQLDRFVDPELVAEKLKAIHDDSGFVVLNGDDRNLTQFADRSKIKTFSLSKEVQDQPQYALNFGPEPSFESSVEVLSASDGVVELSAAGQTLSFATKADAVHQAMNLAAAIAALQELLEPNWDLVTKTIQELPPVFARNEIADIRGRQVRLMLVQNPTSFSLNLDEITGAERPLMLMAGGDIHDPSWLWTVDFSKLDYVDVVGGRNAHELALRLRYQGVKVGAVETEADRSSELFLSLEGNDPTILFSADAMRRTRRYLGLAK